MYFVMFSREMEMTKFSMANAMMNHLLMGGAMSSSSTALGAAALMRGGGVAGPGPGESGGFDVISEAGAGLELDDGAG